MAVYKVNVSLPPQLVEEVDAAAKELGLSRSGFIAEASARYVADVRNLTAEDRKRKDVERAIETMRRVGKQLPKDHDFMTRLRADRERDSRVRESRSGRR